MKMSGIDREEPPGTGGEPSTAAASAAARFQFLQPNRDLQSNWEVDLAQNLEEYLLKICSGEIPSEQEQELHSVNFAEAALLLQGSVQVYSRKVEYLYSLVLHALEFLSEKRQEQNEKASIQPDGSEPILRLDEENEAFLGLDDVPVEARNCMDDDLDKDEATWHFVKPPANLLVLEGDCLDISPDGSELESYLLATCNFYGDFLLLDPCDGVAIHDFLRTNAVGKENIALHRGSSVRSKACHSISNSPVIKSGGTAHKSYLRKNQGVSPNKVMQNTCSNDNHWSSSNVDHDHCDHDMYNAEELGGSNLRDDSDDDGNDPWKPLNPHEPGNLKIRPFRKVKGFGRQVIHHTKRNSLRSQFPIAKLDCIISPEFAESFEVKQHLQERLHEPPPLFEKLRRTLAFYEQETSAGCSGIFDHDDELDVENDDPCYSQEGFDLPKNMYDTEADVPFPYKKQCDPATFDGDGEFEQDNLDANVNLEDLCRSHLDALLSSIAETEKQTELAMRVSTWKQRVEKTLEEQDAHLPFDIHLYGEKVLDKLSVEAGSGGSMSFADVVIGQAKHDVARTFSALLQLVNNGKVDLERALDGGELVCHTATNPFFIRLLSHDGRGEEMNKCSARKRVKSPLRKGSKKSNFHSPESSSAVDSSVQNGRISIKLHKGSIFRCTPDGKKRRRSARLIESFDLQSAG